MRESWRLVVTPPAVRNLDRLSEKAVAAIAQSFAAIAANPQRVGKPLQRELAGRWVTRRGPYRIVYRIDDEAGIVFIMLIGHRADVYRRR